MYELGVYDRYNILLGKLDYIFIGIIFILLYLVKIVVDIFIDI